MDEELRTKTGKVLTDEDINNLADEAERGYDVSNVVPRERPESNGEPPTPTEGGEMPEEGEAWLTNAEVAQLAGVAYSSVGNWVSAGVLPFEKRHIADGRGRRRQIRVYRKQDVEELIRKRADGSLNGQLGRPRGVRIPRGRSSKRGARGLGIDERIANIEREIVAIKKLRESERRDIEQEVKARLIAAMSRSPLG